MRKTYYSHKARHIVKFSSLFITALLDCAVSMADETSDKTKVVIPPADTTTFVYNGSLQTYSLPGDTTLFSIFGNTHTTAGKYEVTVSLKSPLLCEWASQYNRDIGKQLTENLGIDDCRILWTAVMAAVW